MKDHTNRPRYTNSPSYRTATERFGEPSLAYKILTAGLVLCLAIGLVLGLAGII